MYVFMYKRIYKKQMDKVHFTNKKATTKAENGNYIDSFNARNSLPFPPLKKIGTGYGTFSCLNFIK